MARHTRKLIICVDTERGEHDDATREVRVLHGETLKVLGMCPETDSSEKHAVLDAVHDFYAQGGFRA